MDTDSVDEVIVIRKKRRRSHHRSLGVMPKAQAKPRMTKPEPVKAPPSSSSTSKCNSVLVDKSDDDNDNSPSPPVQPELGPSYEDHNDDTAVKAQHTSEHDDPHYWQDAQPREFWVY